jgi:hypothetical protein
VRSQTENVCSLRSDKDARLSSWLSGVDVVGAQDGSWSHLCFTWLYLAAKPSHMRGYVDGLACRLHRPTNCGWQAWEHNPLIGAVMSHHIAVDGGAFLGGVKPPRWDIWRVVDRPGSDGLNLSWRSLILEALGHGCQEPERVLSQVTWRRIWYEVFGCPVVYHWREPVLSRLLDRNRWSSVLRIQDPNSSSWAFHRVGGQSRSLDGRHKRYSHVTTGTITRFRLVTMGHHGTTGVVTCDRSRDLWPEP